MIGWLIMQIILNTNQQLITPKFEQCIFGLFNLHNQFETSATINTDDHSITITLQKNCIPFGHATQCPCSLLNPQQVKLLPPEKKTILVAVSVLIENVDTREVLITKRCSHMRTFPGTWVNKCIVDQLTVF